MEPNVYGSRADHHQHHHHPHNLMENGLGTEWTCRLCSRRCTADTRHWGLFEEAELAQKLMAFAAVQVQENDGLPTIVCTNCRSLVFMTYDFKCQVEKSDHDLRQALLMRQPLHWPIIPYDKSSENLSIVETMVPCLQKSIDNCITFQDQTVNSHEQFIFEITNSCNIASETSRTENQIQSSHLEANKGITEDNSISFEIANAISESESNGGDPTISFEAHYEMKNEIIMKQDKDITNVESNGPHEVLNHSDDSDEKPLILRKQKRFTCNHCIKSFSTLSLLEKHAVIHRRFEILYMCFLCDEQFPTVEKVKSHAVEIHNMHMDKEKILQSTRMRRITGWIKKIDDHDSNKESDPLAKDAKENKSTKFVCKFCCRPFAYQKSYIAHLKTHPDYKDKMLNELNKGPVTDAISDPEIIKNISESSDMNIDLQMRHTESISDIINMEITSHQENTETAPHTGNQKVPDQVTNQENTLLQNQLHTEDTGGNNNIVHSEDDEDDDYDDDNDDDNVVDDDDNDDDEEDDDYPDESNDKDKDDILSANIQCNQCGKLVATQRNLKRHLLTHSGLKYKCSICNKEFSRPDKLREHHQLKHKEVFGKSDSENESSDDNSQEINSKKDKTNRPYKCSMCPKAFVQPQSLNNHEERHKRGRDVQKRYLCEVCSKCFAQSGSLVAHMRTHTGVKPYVCNVCSRAFTKSTYLQLHLRTHSGEKPYICQYCSRAFARANTLARHITMHTGEAKYQCQICTKSFRRLTSLNEHTYTHTGQRPYACKICSKRYNNAGSLYAHTKKCKASQENQEVKEFSVALNPSDNNSPVSNIQSDKNLPADLIIFTEMRTDERITDESLMPEPPTCQFIVADIHDEKSMSNNILEQFTVQEPDVFNMNEKQFKTPYYGLYPSM